MSIRYLTSQEVIAINALVIQKYSPGEFIGVKEPGLLDSAVHRPQQSVFGQDAYPDLIRKAAALFESLAQNHCFHNANKRTAFVALVQFLRYNGYRLTMTQSFAEDFTVDIVNHKYTWEDAVRILEEYCILDQIN